MGCRETYHRLHLRCYATPGEVTKTRSWYPKSRRDLLGVDPAKEDRGESPNFDDSGGVGKWEVSPNSVQSPGSVDSETTPRLLSTRRSAPCAWK